MVTPSRFVAAASMLLFASPLVGCYAEMDDDGPPPAVASAEVEDGYTPAYYDGYYVYYDDLGRPYYYNGGVVVWIQPSSPYYAGLVNHWRLYGPAYHRWYAHYGYRYHGYRAHPGYHRYHGYRGGGYHGGGHRR